MAGRSCYNCLYAICDPEVWLRCLYMGESLVPQCANHPSQPGRLHDVTGTPCPNYRPKPKMPSGAVRLIPLTDGLYAYVDAADYEWLSGYTWWSASGYAARTENGKTIFMHREIMRPPPGMIVDHVGREPGQRLPLQSAGLLPRGEPAQQTQERRLHLPFQGRFLRQEAPEVVCLLPGRRQLSVAGLLRRRGRSGAAVRSHGGRAVRRVRAAELPRGMAAREATAGARAIPGRKGP